jgi:hypothetical protein
LADAMGSLLQPYRLARDWSENKPTVHRSLDTQILEKLAPRTACWSLEMTISALGSLRLGGSTLSPVLADCAVWQSLVSDSETSLKWYPPNS